MQLRPEAKSEPMAEVSKCNCGRGEEKEGVEFVCMHMQLTRFLCGDISSLIRAHLLSVFSLLQT